MMKKLKLLAGLVNKPYSLYVLLVLMIVYLLNQTDRFILGVCSEEISEDLEFGKLECLVNQSSIGNNVSCDTNCHQWTSPEQCSNSSIEGECMWQYSGAGIEYQILAGPVFMLMFTVAGVPMGLLASYKSVNRHLLLSAALLLWTLTTLATSFSQAFWMLLLLRGGLGMFEAVCTPFATAIIADYYDESLRATAFGVYYLGVYIGYSIAFAFELLVTSVGWRWVYRIAAFPGIIVTIVLLVTVKEPPRQIDKSVGTLSVPAAATPTDISPYILAVLFLGHMIGFVEYTIGTGVSCGIFTMSLTDGEEVVVERISVRLAIYSFCNKVILLLSLGAGIRMTGGVVWAYNVRTFYDHYYCGEVNVGAYLSWIPLLGGIIGAIIGGYVADRLAKRYGQVGRLVVLVTSQGIAAPFAAGAIYLPPPYGLICLLPAYILGEMWIGTSLAVVTHLVPPDVVSVTVAIYIFIINNIGSSLNLLVPILFSAIGLRTTMLLMFPGTYLIAAILFLFTSIIYGFTSRDTHSDGSDDGETENLLREPGHMINDDFDESLFDVT